MICDHITMKLHLILKLADPPERIEISDKSITLAEGKKSEKVVCTAEAYPEAHYEWIFNEKVTLLSKLSFINFKTGKFKKTVEKCIRHGWYFLLNLGRSH